MRARTRLAAAVLLALVAATACLLRPAPAPLGVRGPAGRSVVTRGRPTSIATYEKGGRARLAILVTGGDDGWLALAHGLKTLGVPILVTHDWRRAIAHRVIVLYPDLTEDELSGEARVRLTHAVREGATLIAVNPTAPSWKGVFGYESALISRSHAAWRFRPAIREIAPFTHPKETNMQLTWLEEGRDLNTVTYSSTTEAPLAVFDDGSPAMLRRRLGRGTAYAVGLDIGQLSFISQSLRDERIERSYVNEYEPTSDVFLRLIYELYRRGDPAAATLGTVPMGKSLSVLLTHDIDYLNSVTNSLLYEAFERSAGVPATYFMQVKYVSDSSEKAFFTPENLPLIRRVAAGAAEFASHSVAHSPQFAQFPMGGGRERYPSYRPEVIDESTTKGGTVLGELRVSKFLIESLLGAPPVVSFRPGHLSDPYALPEAMDATGYRYSSASTADNSLTHLPFQLTETRLSLIDSPIYEFPVTVEDEELPAMLRRLPQALALAETLSSYGGLFVVLIHPNVAAGKLDFEKGFVAVWKTRAWFGTVSQMGDWWSARDKVEVDADPSAKTVTVLAPRPIDGLLLRVPEGWAFQRAQPALPVEAAAGGVLLRRLKGRYVLRFR